jgi:alpha-glucosidase
LSFTLTSYFRYGVHPFYIEHRLSTNGSSSHGVFLASAAGADILLGSPSSSSVSLVEYRMLGGTLDFYFFSGPSPAEVVEQYSAVVGKPTWQPLWGFGFHLCRWGYNGTNATREAVDKMRAADIPLEGQYLAFGTRPYSLIYITVMWNDIDLYHAYRDFTTDPIAFPADDHREFIQSLHDNHQRCRRFSLSFQFAVPHRSSTDIPIVDAAVAKTIDNGTDFYAPYSAGTALDTFVKNPDSSEYVGQVWPGFTVFPDWFSPNAEAWWTEALKNWTDLGVEFDGIWADMNEASSFCEGSCGSGLDDERLANTSTPFILPGEPGNLITKYPDWYMGFLYANRTLYTNAFLAITLPSLARAEI